MPKTSEILISEWLPGDRSLSSPDSESFTQFWGSLALMFNSRGKHAKAANVTSVAVGSGDSEDHLSHNSRKRQSKIDAQAAEITAVKAKLNKALEENKKLKDLFSTEKMIEAMTKAVSTMTVKGCPKTSKGTQYEGASNYIGRQWQPQLANGADRMLQPGITCVWLNNKIVYEL